MAKPEEVSYVTQTEKEAIAEVFGNKLKLDSPVAEDVFIKASLGPLSDSQKTELK